MPDTKPRYVILSDPDGGGSWNVGLMKIVGLDLYWFEVARRRWVSWGRYASLNTTSIQTDIGDSFAEAVAYIISRLTEAGEHRIAEQWMRVI